MTVPDAGKQYFSARLFFDEDRKALWAVFTGWVGQRSEKPDIEIRKASTVIPNIQIAHWQTLGEDYIIISTNQHLLALYETGGNALIESQFSHRSLSFLPKPIDCVRAGIFGYMPAKNFGKVAFQPAPSPKLRGQILRRDNHRCLLCGARPSNNVHVELHVHHIRPWSAGGATVRENLITLCKTCHGGLEPHFDQSLFSFVHEKNLQISGRSYLPATVRGQKDRIRIVRELNSVAPLSE